MANLTRSQLRTETYNRLGEPTGFYTDAELNQWLQDGVDDFCLAVEPLVTTATADVVANQAEYALPSDYITPKQIHYGASGSWQLLEEMGYEELFRRVLDWEDSTVTGSGTTPPSHWYWRQDHIGLYPKPTSNLTAGLRILYSYRAAAMSGDSSTTGLPEWADRAVVFYCLAMCRAKDRDEMRQAAATQMYRGQVQEAIRKYQRQRREAGPRLMPKQYNYRQYYGNYYPVETVRITG